MELRLTSDTLGIDESIHPPFRTTPSGFSVSALLVTQGCATFVFTHAAPPWADIESPRWGFQLTIALNSIVAKSQLKRLFANLTKCEFYKPILNNMKAT